jgi:uncharacterized RDD family membrane protein YckC
VPSSNGHRGPGGSPAGWSRRFAATFIDYTIIGLLSTAVYELFFSTVYVTASKQLVLGPNRSALVSILFGIGVFLVELVYFGLFEGRKKGQSLGKKALRIAVRDAVTGRAIGFERAFLRRLTFFPDLPVIGYLFLRSIVKRKDRREPCWHDRRWSAAVIEIDK